MPFEKLSKKESAHTPTATARMTTALLVLLLQTFRQAIFKIMFLKR
jgi:hypothetical protein